jgi:hypothetical protein
MDLMGDGDCGGGLGFAAVFRKLRKSSKNQGEGKLRFFLGEFFPSAFFAIAKRVGESANEKIKRRRQGSTGGMEDGESFDY